MGHSDDESTSPGGSGSKLSARLLDLFGELVSASAAQRSAILQQLSLDDPPLHDALTQMLCADASHSPLDSSPLSLLPSHSSAPSSDPSPEMERRIGTRLGAWQIDGVLGRGGMGTVYSAHRADGQYEQEVALKTISAAVLSPATRANFLIERNVLARLVHPDIAPLLDAGVDADGVPWFVMQKVEGAPIDAWCDQRKLDLRQRVQLLASACDAVAFAHRRGILHQDLKPSNLLVTPEGKPRLLDFGLAILLQAGGTTPGVPIAISSGYAAPEILHGSAPTPAMDVYSLGVVLYRLLCGQWPVAEQANALPLRGRGTALPPRAPSLLALQLGSTAVAERGEPDARRLSRRLRGDLDAIAMRCVAVDPEQRYASVEALHDDLQRWLGCRPVSARAGGRAYRMGRMIQRHRVAAAISSVLVLALVAGTAATGWQYLRAQNELAAYRAVGELFEKTLGEATRSNIGSARLQPIALLQATERRLRQLDLGGDTIVLSHGLAALARSYLAIGDYRKATALAREAEALGNRDLRQRLANSTLLTALLREQGDITRAEETARREIASSDFSQADDETKAALLVELSEVLWDRARYQDAERLLDKLIAEAQHKAEHDPVPLAQLLIIRAKRLHNQDRFSEAAKLSERAEALAKNRTDVAEKARDGLIISLTFIDANEAVRLAQEAVSRDEKRWGSEHPQTGGDWMTLGNALAANGNLKEGQAAAVRGLDIYRKAYGETSIRTANSMRIVALSRYGLGDTESAIALARESLRIQQGALPAGHHRVLEAKFALASLMSKQAAAETNDDARKKAADEAVRLLREVLDVGADKGIAKARWRRPYIASLLILGRVGEAKQQAELALAEARALGSAKAVVAARLQLADIKLAQHDDADAEQELYAVLHYLEKTREFDPRGLKLEVLRNLARMKLSQGKPAEARKEAEAMLAVAKDMKLQKAIAGAERLLAEAADPAAKERR
ncbi:protein kinase domain-containing protein [Lysobacter sp. CA196]|uniref:protein kinase domain-containing protein n=1 Tax=Lysobacter sp. CA196 TaxID=3455606 RepID=UPI003F8D5523